MVTANITLYPGGDLFHRALLVHCEQSLKVLVPYLQSCQESGRISGRVADMDFPDGLIVWFGSEEGTIDVHYGRLVFSRCVKWRPWYGLPHVKKTTTIITEEAIRNLVCMMYEKAS